MTSFRLLEFPMSGTATIRSKGQITLPRDVRHALHVGEGDQVAFDVADDGTVTVRGLTTVPADQAWYWTPEWQAGERDVDTDLAAGRRGRAFHSDEEFLAALEEAVEHPMRL